MGIFIILIAYVVIALPGTRGLYAIEGEEAELLFTYPCESTSISLQLSNGDPFYTSTNPGSTQLPPNYVVTNQKDTRRGDNCTLHLTINPVSRKDEGTFILIPYKDGDIMPRLIRIWLGVSYPPDKASCESRSYFDEEWVSLHCTAFVGTIPGQITCYQNGIRIPPLTAPEDHEDNDGTLNQILLARVMTDVVYCCSSTLEQTKDNCECKDWGFDTVHNTLITVLNPCVSTLPPHPKLSHGPSLDIGFPYSSNMPTLTQATKVLPTTPNSQRSELSFLWIFVPLIFIAIATIVVCVIRRRRRGENKYCILSSDDRNNDGSAYVPPTPDMFDMFENGTTSSTPKFVPNCIDSESESDSV